VCVENEAPQRAEWFKYAFLENPRWQTAAILNYLNRYNSATDCPISLKFYYMVTDTEVRERWLASTLKPEVEFRRQRALFRIPFWGHISAADHNVFTTFDVCVVN